MKLNKKGWGFSELLIISLILFIFLFIATYYIYILYSKFNLNANSNYLSLELSLEKAATRYIIDYDLDTTDPIVIRFDDLKKINYISSLKDEDNNDCNGYIIVKKNTYNTYIKCQKYITDGYNSSYEKNN